MITGYAAETGRLVPVSEPLGEPERVVWYDLLAPTVREERAVAAATGIEIPSREEMEEIEESSRFYTDGEAAFLTATLPAGLELPEGATSAPVTFILSGTRLITVRHHDLQSFRGFLPRLSRYPVPCATGDAVLMALLDAVIDRLADALELAGQGLETQARLVFGAKAAAATRGGTDYQEVLTEIGHLAGVVFKVSDSLVTLERLAVFLGPVLDRLSGAKDQRRALKTLSRDTHFLTEHASALLQKVNFLLDATLGMVSIEQNATIKIFSVAAVVFLPPTLIASIYGMNFEHMPELAWAEGYPIALGLMAASVVAALVFFRARGWL